MVDGFLALGASFFLSPQHRLRNRVNSTQAPLSHRDHRPRRTLLRDCPAAGFAMPRTPVATSPAAARSTMPRAARRHRAVRATPARNLLGRVREGKAGVKA